jgi:uncharacterized protein YxjI
MTNTQSSPGPLQALVVGASRVLVKQQKEWGEILVGVETRNRYELRSDNGTLLGHAEEESKGFGAFFLRNVFGPMRSATIRIFDAARAPIGRIEKPFRWFFFRVEVFDGDRRLGAIERKWSWLDRRFVVENNRGEVVLEIVSPLFRIWTFELRFEGQVVGQISKKWGGVLKEWFSDADVFGVEWREHVPAEVRALLLGATFLVDFACFEGNQGH